MTDPLEIFVSCAREDESLRDQLLSHLRVLERSGIITIWHSGLIYPGRELERERNLHIERAQIILLLLSHHFIASDDCYNIEMMRAMKRYSAGNVYLIPILLRPFEWKNTQFATWRVLPMNEMPITHWSERDAAFTHVVENIEKVVDDLLKVNKTGDSVEDGVDSNRLYNTLIRLNYSEQVRIFQQFKNEKRQVGAFLIHGAPSYGQGWLLNRLTKQLPGSSAAVHFKFSFERKACGRALRDLWIELAKWVGLNNPVFPPGISMFQSVQQEIIQRVHELWQRQTVFVILSKLHEIDEEYLNKFIQGFWKPLVVLASSTISRLPENTLPPRNFLVLFLVDSADCVDAWKIALAQQPKQAWEPHIPINLQKLSPFPRDALHQWLEYELDTLPASLTVQNILENSGNGIPELVLEHVCSYFGYEWTDLIKYRV